jgi:hypothetical protein
MSKRTTVAEVKVIMETGLEDPEIDALIGVANRMVTNTLANAGLATDVLKDIESYMTAHLISIGKERQAITERINDIWITYQGDFEFAETLKTTTYGQMVIMLDSSGLMGRASKQKATIRATPQYPEDYQ